MQCRTWFLRSPSSKHVKEFVFQHESHGFHEKSPTKTALVGHKKGLNKQNEATFLSHVKPKSFTCIRCYGPAFGMSSSQGHSHFFARTCASVVSCIKCLHFQLLQWCCMFALHAQNLCITSFMIASNFAYSWHQNKRHLDSSIRHRSKLASGKAVES